MTDYLVEWSMLVENALNPEFAAQEAWETIRHEDSTSSVFEVSDALDMTVQVDLHEDRVSAPVWVPGPNHVADLAEHMNDNGWAVDEIIEMIRKPHKYAREFSEMLLEREYAKVAKEPELPEVTPGMTPSTLRVHFRPEAWIDDHAIEVAVDWDQFEWFVSDETKELIHQAFRTGATDFDFVRDDFFVPKWIAEWDGPFTIEPLADGHPYVNNPEVMRCKWCDLASSVHANDDVFV